MAGLNYHLIFYRRPMCRPTAAVSAMEELRVHSLRAVLGSLLYRYSQTGTPKTHFQKKIQCNEGKIQKGAHIHTITTQAAEVLTLCAYTGPTGPVPAPQAPRDCSVTLPEESWVSGRSLTALATLPQQRPWSPPTGSVDRRAGAPASQFQHRSALSRKQAAIWKGLPSPVCKRLF